MKSERTHLSEVLIIEPQFHRDPRGFFVETYHSSRYRDHGVNATFVQDNVSCSSKGILRGLHFQNPHWQGKLVTVLQGEIYDVAVDIRKGSKSFGQSVGVSLSLANGRQLWVPPGFAHGFCVTSDTAIVSYKCTDFYSPQDEISLFWNDPALKINWPLKEVVISEKDRGGLLLSEIPEDKLPSFPLISL